MSILESINKNFNFIKVNFFILYKRIIEYKSNFYSAFFLEIIYLISSSFFLVILQNSFFEVLNWKNYDYFLFLLFCCLMSAIPGLFIWKEDLFFLSKTGILNSYLIRPINPLNYFMFYGLSPTGLVMMIVDVFFIIFLIIFYKIKLYNIFLGLVIFILIVLYIIFLRFFIWSLDFYKMGFSQGFIDIIKEFNILFEKIPAQFFSKSKVSFLGFFIPHYFISLIFIPVVRDYEVLNFKKYFLILIFIVFLLIIFTKISWKYGLKRYEAFG